MATMRRTILVAVALCWFISETANAGTYFNDGNQLFDKCKDHEHSPQYYDKALSTSACRQYVLGVVDALRDAGTFCIPDHSVQLNQLVDVVTPYLRDHSEKRHLPASDLVTAALKEKFPCN
jgi:Rap1a immunity proteins